MIESFSGDPMPEISWFREGKPIKTDDGRLKTYNLNESSYFEIDKVSILDCGEYTCTASNVMGAIYCNVKVSVEGLSKIEFLDEPNPKNCFLI